QPRPRCAPWPCRCNRPRLASARRELLPAIALEIEQRVKIAVIDAGVRARGDLRLGPIGDAEARGLEHGEIVAAVADRKRVLALRPEPLRKLDQRRALRVPPEDRLLDAGDAAGLDGEPVGAMFLKADHRRDRTGEPGEAAGGPGGVGAGRSPGSPQPSG